MFEEGTDEAHPHVHLCVIARSNDGTRLNPRKADLQSWRESFASHLREHGIEANATRRQARGVTKMAVPQALENMRKKRGAAPERPPSSMSDEARSKRAKTDRKMLRAYGEVARAMAESDDVGDRALAVDIVNLVKEMPVVQRMHDAAALDRPRKASERRADGHQPIGRGRKDGPVEPTR